MSLDDSVSDKDDMVSVNNFPKEVRSLTAALRLLDFFGRLYLIYVGTYLEIKTGMPVQTDLSHEHHQTSPFLF